MTSNVKLLPLPECAEIVGGVIVALPIGGFNKHIRANVEANTQALRAEVERLAEALDIIARVGKASRNQTTRTRWIVARAISALNGDDDWQALSKPKGFHDALLRDLEERK